MPARIALTSSGRISRIWQLICDPGTVTLSNGVSVIPFSVSTFKNGELVDKQIGATQKAALQAKVEALL